MRFVYLHDTHEDGLIVPLDKISWIETEKYGGKEVTEIYMFDGTTKLFVKEPIGEVWRLILQALKEA